MTHYSFIDCPKCGGTGNITAFIGRNRRDGHITNVITCPKCKGHGTIISSELSPAEKLLREGRK